MRPRIIVLALLLVFGCEWAQKPGRQDAKTANGDRNLQAQDADADRESVWRWCTAREGGHPSGAEAGGGQR